MVTVEEERVIFKSHLDGSQHIFTPEKSIAIQRSLGADIILAFDECTSPLHDATYTRESCDRTHRWAERSLRYFRSRSRSTATRRRCTASCRAGLSATFARRARG